MIYHAPTNNLMLVLAIMICFWLSAALCIDHALWLYKRNQLANAGMFVIMAIMSGGLGGVVLFYLWRILG